MFIDYVALQLLVLVIGLAHLVLYFAKFINDDPKRIAPGFLLVGFTGLVTALHMIFVWPLPSSYNIAFGEPLVLFSVLMFGTGLAFLLEWDLLSIGVFALLSGIVAIIVGLRLIDLEMTKLPIMSGLGFIFTGATGILFLPAYLTRQNPVLRIIAALVALVAVVIWAITGYGSYWGHLESFGNWQPTTMG